MQTSQLDVSLDSISANKCHEKCLKASFNTGSRTNTTATHSVCCCLSMEAKSPLLVVASTSEELLHVVMTQEHLSPADDTYTRAAIYQLLWRRLEAIRGGNLWLNLQHVDLPPTLKVHPQLKTLSWYRIIRVTSWLLGILPSIHRTHCHTTEMFSTFYLPPEWPTRTGSQVHKATSFNWHKTERNIIFFHQNSM